MIYLFLQTLYHITPVQSSHSLQGLPVSVTDWQLCQQPSLDFSHKLLL